LLEKSDYIVKTKGRATDGKSESTKEAGNTDHVIAQQEGQARHQSTQKANNYGSNKLKQEHG
jgi:hypothetical protein